MVAVLPHRLIEGEVMRMCQYCGKNTTKPSLGLGQEASENSSCGIFNQVITKILALSCFPKEEMPLCAILAYV